MNDVMTLLVKYAADNAEVPVPDNIVNNNIRDDSIYFGTGLGTIGGAGIGGLIGSSVGDKRNSTKNMLLGSLLGGAAGGLGSFWLQKRSMNVKAPSLIQQSIQDSTSAVKPAMKINKPVSASTPIKLNGGSTKDSIKPSTLNTKSTTPVGGGSLISAGNS